MRLKQAILGLICGLSSISTFAQTDHQAIQQSIELFFSGMHASDSLLIRKVTFKETTLQSVWIDPKDGQASVRSTPFADFVKQIGTPAPNRKIEERIGAYTIHQDGPLATAWTPYTFWINDSFSHCGVNTFTLVKSPTGWKIWAIMDTRRKSDCP